MVGGDLSLGWPPRVLLSFREMMDGQTDGWMGENPPLHFNAPSGSLS